MIPGDMILFKNGGFFSTSNLVRIATKSPVNHAALFVGGDDVYQTESDAIIHALTQGVIRQRLSEHLSSIGYLEKKGVSLTVVRFKPVSITALGRAHSFLGRQYNWLAILGFGWGIFWRGVLRIIGVNKIPFAKNIFKKRMSFYCFELIAECFNDIFQSAPRPFSGSIYKEHPTGKDILKSKMVHYVTGTWYPLIGSQPPALPKSNPLVFPEAPGAASPVAISNSPLESNHKLGNGSILANQIITQPFIITFPLFLIYFLSGIFFRRR
jgi:hypothetical protein